MTDFSTPVDELPTPEGAAAVITERLRLRIVDEIKKSEPIGFDRYWELAMYEPGLGYYSAGARKFGIDGDFVTAPELGTLFAQCLATPVGAVLTQFEDQADILEVGAGTGRFARDLLIELGRQERLPRRYQILELSADLRDRQQETLAEFSKIVRWLDHPPDRIWQGIVIGNEVLDALPAKRVIRNPSGLAEGWYEQRVCVLGDGSLGWKIAELEASLRDELARIETFTRQPLPDAYQTEIQPSQSSWIAAITARMARGAILLVDYGYPRSERYLADRNDGTLICHYRHRSHHDPFLWPGLNDLSVSVDFTSVAEGLSDAGFDVTGFTSQAQFLIDCGLDQVVQQQLDNDHQAQARLTHELKLLTLPAEMGEHVKAMIGLKDIDQVPGFAVNQLHRL